MNFDPVLLAWAKKKYGGGDSTTNFATASWSKISEICENGQAEQYFSLGDTKPITFNDPNGNSITCNVKIVGFNHDILPDGINKASISIVTDIAPFKSRQAAASYEVWSNCFLKKLLNGAVFDSFPVELQGAIKTVKKESGYFYSGSTSINKSEDKVWIPSCSELGLTSLKGFVLDGSSKYLGYTKDKKTMSGSDALYWTRTGTDTSLLNFAAYDSASGSVLPYSRFTEDIYVVFGFCI